MEEITTKTGSASGKRPTAVVMNMFYTGLGIARSLGEHGVPVIGLSSQHGVYGNFTRFAEVRFCPDSRSQPDALLEYLVRLGKESGDRFIIFPTRDDDVLFLDRFREQLAPWFTPVVAPSKPLQTCLSKWETFELARRVGVPAPRCWVVSSRSEIEELAYNLTYPCVVKPVASYDWRAGDNWSRVKGRKAIGIHNVAELLSEYGAIAGGNPRVLVQEMIPGGDDQLLIVAVYLDQASRWVASFNTQKLLQVPEGFGTGCIVQGVDRPELSEPTRRLLQEIGFTGIAEVEYKWDARNKQYSLIEINPRPWDQHRLGYACGVDLIYLAYLDRANLPIPAVARTSRNHRWIAEEAFLGALLHCVRRRDGSLKKLLSLARGPRVWGMWKWNDPLPLVAYMTLHFLPALATAVGRAILGLFRGKSDNADSSEKGRLYANSLDKGGTHGR